MTVRLSVTYAATDGLMPESIEIEWQDLSPDAGNVVLAALDQLLDAPLRRRPLPLHWTQEGDTDGLR